MLLYQQPGPEYAVRFAVGVDVVSSELPTLLQNTIALQLHQVWQAHSLHGGQLEP